MRIQWSLIAALIFALVTAIFAVINVRTVDVNLLFGVVQIPLILLILGSTLLGGIIVGSFGLYRGYRLDKENRRLKAQLNEILEATGYVFPDSKPAEDQPQSKNGPSV
ncbi:lipopolysaccharide assembly protein LapA domain-containing protein [Paenibacillus sp. YPG26]|uniref:LapA family protein n=1 Tax=Paenibacillus sp. YPG26 TaxID=2878915 RepID=UPI0020420A5F|nr:lipopolysaccharide assembly protein LapA domain-containing protein [Paenibacillus sp. YPG26]USB32250.1 lipopolysaccharide assembly protein LapA domain-containing protein [Paenibacillus sp. YPG26]